MRPLMMKVDGEVNAQTPEGIFERTSRRELHLSRLLIAYIAVGLFFMLLPGTFLGVWNLLAISSHRSIETVSAAWIQAHGHAQIFGWIGSFILGIGYYSIPKLRRTGVYALWASWTSLITWSSGVTLRWIAGVYEWHWRVLLPLSGVLEIVAFAIFFLVVSSHHRDGSDRATEWDEWIVAVVAGCIGWLATLVINLLADVFLAWRAASPVLPHGFDQRLLVLETWGFLVSVHLGIQRQVAAYFSGTAHTPSTMVVMGGCFEFYRRARSSVRLDHSI